MRERQTDKQSDRQSDRQTNRQTDKQKVRKTGKYGNDEEETFGGVSEHQRGFTTDLERDDKQL